MGTNWTKVRREYITTDISLSALAKKHKISKSNLYKKSSKEKWNERRKDFGKKVEEFFEEKASKTIATHGAEELERLIFSVSKMNEVIEKAMQDTEQFNRFITTKKVRKPSGAETMESVEKVFEKVDTRAIKDITSAMKELSELIEKLGGGEEKENRTLVEFDLGEEYQR